MLFPTLILAFAINSVLTAPYQAVSTSVVPKTLVVFGDSYSDNCNTWRISANATQRQAQYPFPACPPFPIGRAGGGPSWPEFVANQSLPQVSVINHAYSAATCSNLLFPRNTMANGQIVSIPDVGQQIDLFLKNEAPKLTPTETEIVIFIGTNDLTFFVAPAHAATNTDFLPRGVTINDEARCVVANVARLRNLGYNRVTVFETAPLQYAQLFAANKTQGYGYIIEQNGPFVAELMDSLVTANNALQKSELTKPNGSGTEATIFPIHSLYVDELTNPARYNFAHPGNEFCNICPGDRGSSGDPSQGASGGSPECVACPDPTSYFFWDQLHPGPGANQILATKVIDYLNNPASL